MPSSKICVIATVGLLCLVGACKDGAEEMQVYVVESGGVTTGPVATGVGLGLDVVLRVGMDLGGTEQPADLEVVATDGEVLVEELGGVAFSYGGSVEAGGDEGTLVRLTPLTPGTKTVRFFADNAVEDPTFTIDARTVDTTEFNTSVQGDSSTAGLAREMVVFVGNRVALTAIERSDGEAVLGREELEVEAPEGSGTSMLSYSDPFISQTLEVGDAPHEAIVRSPASGSTLQVHVVDTSSVWVLGLTVGAAAWDGASPHAMRVGEMVSVDVVAYDRQERPIPGDPPSGPTWEIHGSSVSESAPSSRGAWFSADAAGQSTVVFQLGESQAALTIDVAP